MIGEWASGRPDEPDFPPFAATIARIFGDTPPLAAGSFIFTSGFREIPTKRKTTTEVHGIARIFFVTESTFRDSPWLFEAFFFNRSARRRGTGREPGDRMRAVS
jgi:hypothetical protein